MLVIVCMYLLFVVNDPATTRIYPVPTHTFPTRRSSDLNFKPWTEAKAIADGPSILKYLSETADQYRIREKIRFGHRVEAADWDSSAARWTVTARDRKSTRLNSSH